MLNIITIQGRLTKDPVLRYTQSNTPVASFTVAFERDVKNQDGTRKTDFIDCIAWRGAGEFVSKYFAKGDMIAVSGRLELRDWTDRDGNKRRSAEVNTSNIYFCGGKKDNAAGQSEDSAGPHFEDIDDSDGELPF